MHDITGWVHVQAYGHTDAHAHTNGRKQRTWAHACTRTYAHAQYPHSSRRAGQSLGWVGHPSGRGGAVCLQASTGDRINFTPQKYTQKWKSCSQKMAGKAKRKKAQFPMTACLRCAGKASLSFLRVSPSKPPLGDAQTQPRLDGHCIFTVFLFNSLSFLLFLTRNDFQKQDHDSDIKRWKKSTAAVTLINDHS